MTFARLVKSQAVVLASQFGVSVMPLLPAKKRPLLPSWRECQERLATVEEIATWPACNLGIVTGAVSGIVVVDCECPEDAAWFWNEKGKADVIVETPRGFHLYFRHPGGFVGNRARVQDDSGRPRFDIRGDGGYVVAPPSEVEADGSDVKVTGCYRFRRGREMRHPETIAAFDTSWLPATVAYSGGNTDRRIKDGAAYISRITAVAGQRGHDNTFRAAVRLKEAGFSEAEALLALQQWNKTNADPPWSDGELLHKVTDAYRAGAP
jgi:hypothetical protein